MALWSRTTLPAQPRRQEPRLDVPVPAERRGADWGWGGIVGTLGTGPYGGAPAVTPAGAEALGAVLACVELIANAVASLPASLTVDSADGRVPAPPTAPAWRLLARPNDRQSWPAFVSMTVASYLLHGNALAMIQVDGRGAPLGLVPVPWNWLTPLIVTGNGGPRLVYDLYQHTIPEAAILGLPGRLLDSDVLHVRARSDGGVIGRSVLSRAAGPVREGIAISQLAASNWANGARPSAVMTSPNFLTDKQRADFGAGFIEKFTGALNAGRVPLIEGGFTFSPVALTSVESELLSTRQFSVAEIARLFSVPEPLLQLGQRVPPGIDAYVTTFAQLCLAPIVAVIESEFDHAVLPAGMHLQIDLAGLMRGSFSAVVAGMAALKQSGIITANDAREELNWPARPDGDTLGIGPAPSWPADGAGSTHLGPSPGKTGNGPSEPGTNENQGAGG